MDYNNLIESAVKAMENSYAPYSNFKVGAALLCQNGEIYTGCNIENSAFSATVCAERTAIFKAISEGNKSFTALAVVGGKDGVISKYCYPCGVCRQVLSEFCSKDFKVVLFDNKSTKICTLDQLLPLNFGSDSLC